MKSFFKIVAIVIAILIVAVGALLLYVKMALPNVGDPEDIKIEYTAERIARGEYLANCVSVCMDCHSIRDWSKFSGPIADGTFGQGGQRFDQTVGFPGVFYSKNITPAGISRYTDGELFRVISTGVTKEGRAMFPLMPYPYYGKMDREDIYSIIAYIRSIPSIKNEVPESKADFPLNFILNTIPKKAELQKRPDPSDGLAYGAYMTNASGCIECHTQVDKGQIIPEFAFGGGREFQLPDGSVVRSANISPHPETGIGKWTRESFIARFKVYADSAYSIPSVNPGEFNTLMPWTMYANMKEEDLAAIFDYLQTVKPIENGVEKFTAGKR
ncbi:MAG TPA: c-type cytochrome [Cyclobacteriaceae bacterium]|nr:c-type cytochrome [Cyclobacteriaceae bacterium]